MDRPNGHKRGKLGSLATISTEIRGRLDAAKFIEQERMMVLDIKAQRLRCQAAMVFFTQYEQIEAACQRRRTSVGNWCKNQLGCGVKHLRKLRQLHERWGDYVIKRQSYEGDRHGLRLAFDLVGIPTDGESNAPTVGDQNDADQNDAGDGQSGRYWLTPPDVIAWIRQEFGEYWDACPYPLPAGHDALAMEDLPDGQVIYINAPFTRKNELHGRPLIDYARLGVTLHKKGKTVIMAIPVTDVANLLLAAGAEVRSLGRCAWLDVDTGEPWTNPGASALFILRAKPRS